MNMWITQGFSKYLSENMQLIWSTCLVTLFDYIWNKFVGYIFNQFN